jgi:hypothetical protein
MDPRKGGFQHPFHGHCSSPTELDKESATSLIQYIQRGGGEGNWARSRIFSHSSGELYNTEGKY